MRRLLVVALVLLPSVVGCRAGARDTEPRELRVLAAASLTEAFTAIGPIVERVFDGADVSFQFGGSSALVEQVNQGSPGDVIVTADETIMRGVEGAGSATVIARNRLAIIVEPGNPKRIRDLEDLDRDDVVLVMCAAAVPCGKFGARALDKAGVTVEAASFEESVKGVVSKVTLGEADAGIVYVTDVLAAGDNAEGVDIDIAADPDLEAVYSVAVLREARASFLAEAFIDVVVADDGQDVLRKHGFLAP